MMNHTPKSVSGRRGFLKTSVFAAASTGASLNLLNAQSKSGSKPVIVGSGEHQYEVVHNWAQLPDQYSWQITHNVAVDKAGNLYVIHEGDHAQQDHPAIFVFDPEGKFIKAFGNDFQGGGHGLEVREEAGTEYLYVTGYQMIKKIAKLTLDGEMVWERYAPMDSGVYAAGEDKVREKVWGRDRFMPTNFAFLPDGGFLLADGYGAHCVHRYDKEANYVSTFGKSGKGDGEFNLPHGIWIDDRGSKPTIVVADRANNRLQWFDLEGGHLKTQGGHILPANLDRSGDLLLVPDLSARITLLDKDNKAIYLGEDEDWRQQVLADKKAMRRNPAGWVDGKFVHPHDACFGKNGDIFVAEWVATGRVSKLKKVS